MRRAVTGDRRCLSGQVIDGARMRILFPAGLVSVRCTGMRRIPPKGRVLLLEALLGWKLRRHDRRASIESALSVGLSGPGNGETHKILSA